MPPTIDIRGHKFGKLVAIERSENSSRGMTTWKCDCECGMSKVVQTKDLTSGNTKSCGCLGQGRRWPALTCAWEPCSASFVVEGTRASKSRKYCSKPCSFQAIRAANHNCSRCGGPRGQEHGTRCKRCRGEEAAERRPFRRCSAKDTWLRHRYGITEADFNEMLELQGGKCALCRRGNARNTDHDHLTGEVRGLLCSPCNTALGVLGDNVDGLLRAIEYLRGNLPIQRRRQRAIPDASRMIPAVA